MRCVFLAILLLLPSMAMADPTCTEYCAADDIPQLSLTQCAICVRTVRDCAPQDGTWAPVYWQTYPDGTWYGPYYTCASSDYWKCFVFTEAGTYRIAGLGCLLDQQTQEYYPTCLHIITVSGGETETVKCVVCDCLPEPCEYDPTFP